MRPYAAVAALCLAAGSCLFVLSFLFSSDVNRGPVAGAMACFLGITARILQASGHHRERMKAGKGKAA